MPSDDRQVVDDLRRRISDEDPRTLCVAFSGGTDSTAVLHALACLPEARTRGLRALHVDHGLNPQSRAWAAHCRVFCQALEIPFEAREVVVDATRGEGVEAAARRARYAAFKDSLAQGEWLVLAHQRDDQIETVLLKLLRGAGPDGIAGMRAKRPLGRGMLWRPLLDTPRRTLAQYLAANAIHGVGDPSNHDPRFARNVLRHEILPALTRHWPQAGTSILHSAQLCRMAGDYLAREAEAALPLLRRADLSLDADGWRVLPDALRAPVLDRWLREQGLPVPADAQRRELERQTCHAADDAAPCVAWSGAEIRVWDGRLHATPPLAPPPITWQSTWNGEPLALPEGCGSLVAESASGFLPAARAAPGVRLEVRLRRGGERIKPAGTPHTRKLRVLFQQSRIPPWLRCRCPLLYVADELIAVADWWTSEHGEQLFARWGARPRWQRPAWSR